jgi:hypothetical protein
MGVDSLRKVTLEEKALELNGMPWYAHNGNRLWRLPVELEDEVSRALWTVSQNTSGGRIRFRSDTTMLGILADYHKIGNGGAREKIGSMGMDVYADGAYWNSVYPHTDGLNETLFFENADRLLRDITIYLPLYHAVDIHKILLDDQAVIEPPSTFAVSKPVVFYGTSITQGGCASRSGLSYQAQLARELNLDFINLGFSGLGRGDLPVARAVAKIDASCYVLDYAQNNTSPSELRSVYLPFLTEIRNEKPDAPVILTTPITYRGELWNMEFREEQEQKRQVIRDAYRFRIEMGDRAIDIVEGRELLSSEDGEGQMDGAHPNDIGFRRMADGLTPILRTTLHL